LHINFQQDKLNSYDSRNYNCFCNYTNCGIFLTSERNLNTLVKVNRLSKLIETCLEGSKLLAYRFSARYS